MGTHVILNCIAVWHPFSILVDKIVYRQGH